MTDLLDRSQLGEDRNLCNLCEQAQLGHELVIGDGADLEVRREGRVEVARVGNDLSESDSRACSREKVSQFARYDSEREQVRTFRQDQTPVVVVLRRIRRTRLKNALSGIDECECLVATEVAVYERVGGDLGEELSCVLFDIGRLKAYARAG